MQLSNGTLFQFAEFEPVRSKDLCAKLMGRTSV